MDLPGWEITGEGVTPEAAIEFWKARAKLTDAEAKALAAGTRHRAFYAAGLARHDLVQLVSDGIQKALEDGETLADFKTRIMAAIETQGWHDHRVENIFRTNMQTAYMAGRYKKMQAVEASRPYWQYIAVMDRRVRPSHAILHGKVYPADHEFWSGNYPPNGFRCRCTVRTLSERQVQAQGLTVEKEMPKDGVWTDPKTGMEYFVHFPGADKGFRNNPGKDWLVGLDLNKYPDVAKESYAEQRGNSIVQPVGTNDELAAQIMDKATLFTANGPVKQVLFTKEGYFMATDSRGRLFISQRDFPSANGVFNPAKELMNAWNNIAKGKPLSFHEEYAMESLWHEIVHNRQKPTNPGGKESLSRRMMETVTQWVARRTYPRFMESIGGKATQLARVLREGYGYGLYIRNFDKLLDAVGVKDDQKALSYFEEVCRREDRKYYQKAIVDYLVQHADKPVKRATFNVLLSRTSISAARYDALLRFHNLSG